MRPLRVRIDVTEGTATPAQPDPQTIHLNAAQTQQPQKRPPTQMTSPPPLTKEDPAPGASLQTPRTAAPPSPLPQHQEKPLVEARSTALPKPANLPAAPAEPRPAPSNPIAPSDFAHPHTASCARLVQTADIPPETARLVRCHNPWPSEDVLFCPDGALPAFVTGIPALSSGPLSIPLTLASLHYQSASPRSSSSSSMSCSRSSRTSSARVMTTWVILLCWSMGSRPMGLLSANLTGGRTLQSVGKK